MKNQEKGTYPTRIIAVGLSFVLAISLALLPGVSAFAVPQTSIDYQGKTAAQIVSQMTLKQKVEQMIMPAIRTWTDTGATEAHNVLSINSEIEAYLAQHNFAGLCLFRENVDSTAQIVTLTSDVQRIATVNGNLPYLLSIDQEGGSVYRLIQGTLMPGNMALAATGDTANAKTVAQIMGEEIAACGLNIDFAPDTDVNTEPSNPIIGLRSFSDDPETVAAYATAYIAGLHDAGVAATVKHFPGHGDTATDSHTGLPLVDKTLSEISACELVPFAAVLSSTDMVMTAHIQFPQIETTQVISKKDSTQVYLPATLSKTIITDVLRGTLGYDGVVCTDALNMDAINDHFGSLDAAEYAINAGVDILLMPVALTSMTSTADMDAYVQGIIDKVNAGDISLSRIDESVTRIVQLKVNRGIFAQDGRTLAQKISDAEAVVGSADNHATERAIAQKAITTVKNAATLPVELKSGDNVLLLASREWEIYPLEQGMKRLIEEGVVPAGVEYKICQYALGEQDLMDEIATEMQDADYVICLSRITGESSLNPNDADNGWRSACVDTFIAQAHEVGIPAIVVSVGLPYDVARYTEADAVMAAFGNVGDVENAAGENINMGPNIPAALDVIFGAASPQGTLPVDIPALNEDYTFADTIAYARGYGILSFDKDLPKSGDATQTNIMVALCIMAGTAGTLAVASRRRKMVCRHASTTFKLYSRD